MAGQSPAAQATALIHAGVPQDSIHIEQASGYKAAWPERDLMLSRLHRGDAVKITRLDRLFHSVQNLITLGTELRGRGIRIQAVEQGIDSESPDGRDLFGMLASLAEINRELVTAQTNDGLAKAWARGSTSGRRRALTDAQVEDIRRLLDSGATITQIARQFTVARSTIYYALGIINRGKNAD